MPSFFQCGRYRLPLNSSPLVMGILNLTPDSFFDGGRYSQVDSAVARVEQMIAAGADIIDIGAESTRPGALPLAQEEELNRLIPVLDALRDCGKPISVDTRKPDVMQAALASGADMINDVSGFQTDQAILAMASSNCGLCIMHMQNQPQLMQQNPAYQNVVREVTSFLQSRVQALESAGIARARLCVDPGFGFGKTLAHNLELLKQIGRIRDAVGLPLLAGLSRKSMLGAITGRPVELRLAASLAAALVAVSHGAQIVRVHDVAETVDALKVWCA